jgi:hypothetical protein
MLSSRSLTLCAVAGVAAVASPAAQPMGRFPPQVAKTNALTVRLTFLGRAQDVKQPGVSARLTIRRADGRRFTYRLTPIEPGADVAPPLSSGSRTAVRIRRVEAPEPDVLVDLYTGGAHCCYYTTVFRYSSFRGRYVRTTHDWGDPGYWLEDLDGDGLPEFMSADDRFAYAFTSYASSVFPIQIWTLRRGRFLDVTRRFPAAVRRNAKQLWHEYLRDRGTFASLHGLFAAFMADECLLGLQRSGWAALRHAAARGDLNHRFDSDSAAVYLAHLRSFLRRSGYLR